MNHSGYAHEIQVDHEHINIYGDTLRVNNDKCRAMQSMMLYTNKTGRVCITKY
jgi:hypothetical protein